MPNQTNANTTAPYEPDLYDKERAELFCRLWSGGVTYVQHDEHGVYYRTAAQANGTRASFMQWFGVDNIIADNA